jgi:hypothetical protein
MNLEKANVLCLISTAYLIRTRADALIKKTLLSLLNFQKCFMSDFEIKQNLLSLWSNSFIIILRSIGFLPFHFGGNFLSFSQNRSNT